MNDFQEDEEDFYDRSRSRSTSLPSSAYDIRSRHASADSTFETHVDPYDSDQQTTTTASASRRSRNMSNGNNNNNNGNNNSNNNRKTYRGPLASSEVLKNPMEYLSWCLDGRHIVSTLYDLLLNAQESVYISVSVLKWDLVINPSTGMTLLHMIMYLCNNEVPVYLLLGERMLLNQKIPHAQLPPKCFIKIVPQFGPTVKDESVVWVDSIDALVRDTTSVPIEDFNNKTISELGLKGVYEHNHCYILVDRRLAMLGAIELDDTLNGTFQHREDEQSNDHNDQKHDVGSNQQSQQNSTTGGIFSILSTTSSPVEWIQRHLLQSLNNACCSMDLNNGNGSNNNNNNHNSLADLEPPDGISPLDKNKTQMMNQDHNSSNNSTSTRSNKVQRNKYTSGTTFHRVAVVVRATPDLNAFVLKNWEQAGNASPIATPYPQLRLVGSFRPTNNNNCNSELQLIYSMIEHATDMIYIETPHLNSTDSTTNRIIEAIVNRLLYAHERCLAENGNFSVDPCRAVILTNANYAGGLLERLSSIHTDHSADYAKSLIGKNGFRSGALRNRLFMGYLCAKSRYIYIKSTVVIQDCKISLLTSSHLNDRSMSGLNTELGIVIEHEDRVADLRQYLWQDHLRIHNNNGNNLVRSGEFFRSCYKEDGNICRFRIQQDLFSSAIRKVLEFVSSLLRRCIKR